MFGSGPKTIPGVPYDIQRIYNQLTPQPKELLQNAHKRRFIKEGEVGVYNSKERRTKRRHFFLFNDVLLITKREGKAKFWLKVYVSLRSSLKVEDVPDSLSPGKVEFRIYAPKKTFILFARTNDEKNVWLKDIKGAIAGDYDRMDGSIDSPSYRSDDYENSSDFSVNLNVDSKPQQQQQQTTSKYELSGNIGTIDIPGVHTRRLSGDNSGGIRFDSSSDEEGGNNEFKVFGFDSNQQTGLDYKFTTPPTPSSTPVTSGIDDFAAIAQRQLNTQTQFGTGFSQLSTQPFANSQPFGQSQPLTNQPFGQSQPLTNQPFAQSNPISNFAPIQSQPFANSQPFGQSQPLTNQPFGQSQPLSGGFQQSSQPFANSAPFAQSQPFANSQPISPQPFSQPQPQPFANSQPLSNPFGGGYVNPSPSPFGGSQPLQPTILQPTSSNNTPSSSNSQIQMGNFAALKNIEPTQPQNNNYNW